MVDACIRKMQKDLAELEKEADELCSSPKSPAGTPGFHRGDSLWKKDSGTDATLKQIQSAAKSTILEVEGKPIIEFVNRLKKACQ